MAYHDRWNGRSGSLHHIAGAAELRGEDIAGRVVVLEYQRARGAECDGWGIERARRLRHAALLAADGERPWGNTLTSSRQ